MDEEECDFLWIQLNVCHRVELGSEDQLCEMVGYYMGGLEAEDHVVG